MPVVVVDPVFRRPAAAWCPAIRETQGLDPDHAVHALVRHAVAIGVEQVGHGHVAVDRGAEPVIGEVAGEYRDIRAAGSAGQRVVARASGQAIVAGAAVEPVGARVTRSAHRQMRCRSQVLDAEQPVGAGTEARSAAPPCSSRLTVTAAVAVV